MNMNFNSELYKEEQALLKYALNKNWLRGITQKNHSWSIIHGIELIINPACNQKCKYCYITKYGDQLYPTEIRVSKEVTAHNLDLFLNYLEEKKIFCPVWDIFGGDYISDGLIWDMLDIFFNHFYQLYLNHKDELFQKEVAIIMPNNLSCFYRNVDLQNKFIEYQNKFFEINTKIHFSWSTDGKYCTDDREQKELTDEYWDEMFTFCNKIKAGFHPMISASAISHWKENYDWWLEQIQKYNLAEDHNRFQPMSLEIRNNDWTDEQLNQYCEFLAHMFKRRLEMCNNDLEQLAYHLVVGDGENGSLKAAPEYDPLALSHYANNNQNERISCSMQGEFHLILSNLTFPICHRLSYQHLIGGKFLVENDKIVDIIPENVTAYLGAKTCSNQFFPKCASCEHNLVCVKTCFGANYESTGEMFIPAPKACKMLAVKYTYLAYLYINSGILDIALQNNYFTNDMQEFKNYLLDMQKRFEKQQEEIKNGK